MDDAIFGSAMTQRNAERGALEFLGGNGIC